MYFKYSVISFHKLIYNLYICRIRNFHTNIFYSKLLINFSNFRIQPNFVCFRGLLTMLFCTPFSPRDGWIISAAKWRGTIYLYAYKTLEEKRRCADFPPRVHRIMSWGFKFEKYILSGTKTKMMVKELIAKTHVALC